MLSSADQIEARHRELFANRAAFVQGHSAEKHYEDVLRLVEELRRPGEKIEFPSMYGAGALDQLWSIYEALKRRERETPTVSPAEVAKSNQYFAAVRERNDYVFARAHLEDRKRFIPNWAVFCEFIGLKDDDLEAPAEQYGNLERGRYERISAALHWLNRPATAEDFARLPTIVQQRRADSLAREQIERSKRIEAEVAELKAQLAKVQSQSEARELVEDADIILDMRKVM